MVELFNRTLLNMLASTAEKHLFDWESQLRPLCLAYNTSVHPTTGYTPFYLMYGRQVPMPIDIMFGTPSFHTAFHRNMQMTSASDWRRPVNKCGNKWAINWTAENNYMTRRSMANCLGSGVAVLSCGSSWAP